MKFLQFFFIALALLLTSVNAAEDLFMLQKQISDQGDMLIVRRIQNGFTYGVKMPLLLYSFAYRDAGGQEYALGTLPNYPAIVRPGMSEFDLSKIHTVVNSPDGGVGVYLSGKAYSVLHICFQKSDPENTAALSYVKIFGLQPRRAGFKLVAPDRFDLTMDEEGSSERKTHVLALGADHKWTLDGAEYFGNACVSYGGHPITYTETNADAAGKAPNANEGAVLAKSATAQNADVTSAQKPRVTNSSSGDLAWALAAAGLPLLAWLWYRRRSRHK
ncbi:hypothetical protein [Prosthecobacter vanneervenii]|uniref:Uncharacterized protein n=1 Tax=Prosthecobacter vanneervenii TaxID=48466 RepID=A0A7W7YBV3_9BACT|nr:hypothetical protein [Prosthecobacter vanneervenii]MBB5033220.1 hypothetical protein [Prosthecobacter vanneervenii]